MGCAAALAQTASGCFYNASSHLSIQWDLKGKSAAYSSSNMLINEKFIEMYLFFLFPPVVVEDHLIRPFSGCWET